MSLMTLPIRIARTGPGPSSQAPIPPLPVRSPWTADAAPFTVAVMIEAEPWSYHVDGSPVYSLADIIRKRSAITEQGIALTEAGRVTSFPELDQRSSQVARALQRKDVRPGDRVAYIGASGPEFAEGMYGAAKCRAVFTAVNNPLSARQVLGLLADAQPRVVAAD